MEKVQSKRPKKKVDLLKMLFVGLAALIGAGFGYIMMGVADKYGQSSLHLVFYGLLSLVAATALHILVHEMGHMIMGKLFGFSFSSFMVGSWMWIKKDGKIQFKKLSIAGAGGQCLMAPPEGPPDRRAYLWYNLGGGLANLFLSLIFLALIPLFKGHFALIIFAWTMIILGLFLGLTNLIPFSGGAMPNDGKNILDLYKHPESLEGFDVNLRMAQKQVQGVRIKDMPEAWFLLSEEADLKSPLAASRAVFACNRMMDLGDYARAQAAMEALLLKDTALASIHRGLVEVDLVTCALLLGQPDRVEIWMGEAYHAVMKGMKDFPSVVRTGYGLALIRDGDEQEARKYKDRFESIAKTYPYEADIQSEREIMEDLLKASI